MQRASSPQILADTRPYDAGPKVPLLWGGRLPGVLLTVCLAILGLEPKKIRPGKRKVLHNMM